MADAVVPSLRPRLVSAGFGFSSRSLMYSSFRFFASLSVQSRAMWPYLFHAKHFGPVGHLDDICPTSTQLKHVGGSCCRAASSGLDTPFVCFTAAFVFLRGGFASDSSPLESGCRRSFRCASG